ncbi:acyl-CoA thioester hydrolase [Jannaschia faecimaris]|uniref:Acyl-CoA thioester hydrolase n=1 Tax=Jannaschia faecimaris TaxID=1244108 RepID=A0A1H3SJT4_9RHOB|nr:thioesterase family protein [Jannaschia faecimaris]SDZ37970.1 acyl-CoA thioester hydrolase [Jannaschia faecimaris]
MDFPLLTPLSIAHLRDQGIPAPFAFGMGDRVRFHELDVLEHVNNARYLSWFETARIAYLRAYGIGDYSRTGERPVLVLKSVAVDYKVPLHLEDVYIVAGRTRAFRNTSWTMEYGVWHDKKLCATSTAVIVLMEADFVTRKRLPDSYTRAFKERDGSIFEG